MLTELRVVNQFNRIGIRLHIKRYNQTNLFFNWRSYVQENVLWYQSLGMNDVDRVGGKNASLGEMISNLANVGVQVPTGFATTSFAFNEFLEQSGINEKIYQLLDDLDVDDISALGKCGAIIRQWI
ncbi:MAG: pyruvate,water dikinase, partial [Colwellia sp.]